MKRVVFPILMVGLALAAQTADAQSKKIDDAKKSLQPLNDFVGTWSGDAKADGLKKDIWVEGLEWGWKFTKDDAWMVLKFKDSKTFKSGDIRYNPEKMLYVANMVDLKDQKLTYEGKLDNDTYILERVDDKTKEAHRLRINVAGDGIFLNMASARKGPGKTLFSPEYKVSYKMEGAGFAKEKKQECVVSGGLGTGAVTYKGQTYFICCSGCRDAFNENPEFYVKQFEAKKGKK
ncbi:MAG: YHS domain-containing protein [Planctomycetia bacterium]|nr:YHS domain-containing protein [Planctomycetia bacterium]